MKAKIACFAVKGFAAHGCSRTGAEFDPGNVIHLGLSSFTALLWSRYYRLILHQLGTSLAARQLAADETNILITLQLQPGDTCSVAFQISTVQLGSVALWQQWLLLHKII